MKLKQFVIYFFKNRKDITKEERERERERKFYIWKMY
jgi:hypothetical protein